MEILAGLPPLLSLLNSAGPIPVAIATGFVGIIAALILSSKVREILAGTRAVEQTVGFQGSLLDLIRMLRDDELKLRARIQDLEARNDFLGDERLRLNMQLSLVRNQRRRLLAFIRQALRSGSLQPLVLEPRDAKDSP